MGHTTLPCHVVHKKCTQALYPDFQVKMIVHIYTFPQTLKSLPVWPLVLPNSKIKVRTSTDPFGIKTDDNITHYQFPGAYAAKISVGYNFEENMPHPSQKLKK